MKCILFPVLYTFLSVMVLVIDAHSFASQFKSNSLFYSGETGLLHSKIYHTDSNLPTENKDTLMPKPKNRVGIELGGNALLYSLNYERLFYIKSRLFLGIGAGFSYVHRAKPDPYSTPVAAPWHRLIHPIHDAYFAYPLQVSINYGQKHIASGGVSYVTFVDVYEGEPLKVYDRFGHWFLNAGYTWLRRPETNGIFLSARFMVSPFKNEGFQTSPTSGAVKLFPFYFGFSIGYTF